MTTSKNSKPAESYTEPDLTGPDMYCVHQRTEEVCEDCNYEKAVAAGKIPASQPRVGNALSVEEKTADKA